MLLFRDNQSQMRPGHDGDSVPAIKTVLAAPPIAMSAEAETIITSRRSYSDGVRRYIRFHGKRHPQELGATHVEAFLSSLAHQRNVAASTQNQALSAILFLYKSVLKVDLAWMDGIARAKRPLRLPVVLTEQEARRLLDEMRASTR